MENKIDPIKFLETYSEILKEGVDIIPFLPLYTKFEIAGAGIRIYAYNDYTDKRLDIAWISVDDNTACPSMPISPVAATFARLFVATMNSLIKE